MSGVEHELRQDPQTGSWFPVVPDAELAPEVRGLLGRARERLGFVPNVFRVYAFRPQRLSAWFAHYRQLHEPTPGLSAADRELVAVVVSQANGCLYCLVAHGAALRSELGDPVLGERVSYDWRRAGLDARREAICAYAEKLTLRPREVGRDDLKSLLDAGLTIEEAWDVAELAAMYNYTNRMAMATNMLPNEQYSAQARPPGDLHAIPPGDAQASSAKDARARSAGDVQARPA
ncbi:MAG TPA: peroxidase-related enzyme [Solirubrobacteraceae bacterium]|nr:peroxidase-related enzyme [Solirubrobacteraceae bacterium]